MANILVISPHRGIGGWSIYSRRLIECLALTAHNLAIRPFYYNNQTAPISSLLKSFEEQTFDKIDVVFQVLLPQDYYWFCDAKNVGISFIETKHLTNNWAAHMNNMDLLLANDEYHKSLIQSMKVNTPIQILSPPLDLSEYTEEKLDLPQLKDHFNFYTVSDYSQRKNLEALLIAFHREFRSNEPVQLILKLSGVSSKKVNEDFTKLKQKMRLYRHGNRYHNELIITNHLSDKELWRLHNSCQCFVSTSHNESPNLALLDAAYSGANLIATSCTGMDCLIEEAGGLGVNSYEIPVYVDNPPAIGIYTSRETWRQIDILDLQSKTREAYEGKQEKNGGNIRGGIEEKHSYRAISRRLEEIIDNVL